MKRTSYASIPLLLALAACGANLPQAEDAENADESGDSGKEPQPERRSMLSSADPMVGVTVKDETTKKAVPCGGANVPDLLATLGQASCEAKNANPDANQRDVKDVLEIKVVLDSPKVAPGSTAKVTITYHNKGKTELPLDFLLDPEPRFDFEVYTPKGTRVDNPAGAEPPLPPEVSNTPEAEKTVSRITLAPQGNAKVSLTWNVVKYKWVSKDRAKGALPGHGYPREPGGPLGKGKYVLRVITPLVGVLESDHEVSQPRVPVEVGSL